MFKESDIVLSAKHIVKQFPASHGRTLTACNDINLNVYKGKTLGIVGESGCGKSTFVRMVISLDKPTSGEILYHGKNLADLSKKETWLNRQNMQMVFQDPYASLNPRMTAGDIIAEPIRIFQKQGLIDMSTQDRDNRVEELMEKVGLSRFFKNRYPHEFSGGQRQRIGIARALALNPELILCDEPVSALDVSIQSQILNLFKDLQEEFGLTYLFIAHDLSVIKYISNRVAVMYLGLIVEIADAADLYKKPLHPYTEALLSAAPIPDPKIEAKRKRIILTGDVPSPDKQRPGCNFYDRCPKRMDICKERRPSLKDAEDGHEVSCFLYHKSE